MSTILLIALFVSLCLMQWFFSKNRISLIFPANWILPVDCRHCRNPHDFGRYLFGRSRHHAPSCFVSSPDCKLSLLLSVPQTSPCREKLFLSGKSCFLKLQYQQQNYRKKAQETCAFLINMIVRILLSPRSDAPSAGSEVYTDRTQTAESWWSR